jgi:hypothetical protein
VTADARSKVYGNADPALTYQITSGNLVGSDTLSGALARAAGENVGIYAINQNSLANANYALTYVGANLGVTPAPLLITANDTSRPAGLPNPAFSATVTGLASTDTPAVIAGLSITSPATFASPVGTYPIIPSGATASNYTITFANGVLTVTPPLLLFGTYYRAIMTPYFGPVNEPPGEGGPPSPLCTSPPLGSACAGVPYPDNQKIGSWIVFAGP